MLVLNPGPCACKVGATSLATRTVQLGREIQCLWKMAACITGTEYEDEVNLCIAGWLEECVLGCGPGALDMAVVTIL